MATFNTRIQHKKDTKANWDAAGQNNFIPLAGELIFYTDLNKIKMGDGTHNVTALPFIGGDSYFVTGTQTSKTNIWTGAAPSGVTSYTNGLTIDYYLPQAGTSSGATLNLGELGAKKVYRGNADSQVTTQFAAKSVIHLTYISSLDDGNGGWKASAFQNTNTTYTAMTGASSEAAGSTGLVPAPVAGDQEKFLKGNGTWGTVSTTDTWKPNTATQEGYVTAPGGLAGANRVWKTDDEGNPAWRTDHSSLDAASGGVATSLVTTGEKFIWNNKTSNTGTVTSITAGDGLSGGTITSNGTISLATSGVTANSYGPIADVSGANGNTIAIPQITVDSYGRVTGVTERTYTSVNTDTNTDTKNTTGSTNTSSKIFLVGATTQAANPQTYSDNEIYATSGVLTTKSTKIGGDSGVTLQFDSTNQCLNFIFA